MAEARRPRGSAPPHRLRREIVLALALKLALLYLLWWAFFSHAPSKQYIAADIARHLAGGQPPSPVSNPSKEPTP
ncbi:MAG: hypothetical protein PHG43_13810 [Phenylobacterium sp.]|nr:hypothetical protein [Phenylobacterium sp.]